MPINTIMIGLGILGALVIFGYLALLANAKRGISKLQFAGLLIAFVVSLLLTSGQVKVVS